MKPHTCFKYGSQKCVAGRLAFSLVEMLVVIGIIVVLAGLLLPAINGGLLASRKTKSLSNLRSIGMGIGQYATENQNCYPPLSQYGYHNPYWSDYITPYLSPAPTFKSASGTKFTASAIMMDPLLSLNLHHNLGDYGANTLVFIPPPTVSSVAGKSLASISNLGSLVIVMSSGQPNGKDVCGSWQIVAPAYISTGATGSTSSGAPDDRKTGTFYCLFGDGHTTAIATNNFRNDAASYLTPN